jgi:hypothetical protein
MDKQSRGEAIALTLSASFCTFLCVVGFIITFYAVFTLPQSIARGHLASILFSLLVIGFHGFTVWLWVKAIAAWIRRKS